MVKKVHVTMTFLMEKTLAMPDISPLIGSKTILLTKIGIRIIKKGMNVTTAKISAK